MDLVGSVTPCAPFVASRCKTACPDPSGPALPYLSSSGGRLMQLIRTVGKQKAAKWFATRRGETAEYRINLQTKLVFIERNGTEPDKEPSPMLENFLQTRSHEAQRARER